MFLKRNKECVEIWRDSDSESGTCTRLRVLVRQILIYLRADILSYK